MHPTTQKWRSIRKAIGNNIHHYRMEKRFTIKNLSDLSGISYRIIDNYELGKGQANLYVLIKIGLALQIDLRNLFERID